MNKESWHPKRSNDIQELRGATLFPYIDRRIWDAVCSRRFSNVVKLRPLKYLSRWCITFATGHAPASVTIISSTLAKYSASIFSGV